jgi:hypothetical protein
MTRTTSSEAGQRVALAPDFESLSERGVRAWTEQMAVRPVGEQYAVDSESGATYVVDPAAGTCTCPDRELRGETCKHLRRVAIEITAGRVPPPGHRHADCVACGVETAVPADREPLVLCSSCDLAPGDVVLDRETGDRLVVVRVTADPADEASVPGGTTTVAAYPTNEGYPADDPVVEAVYASSVLREDDPRRYLFPLSRLSSTDDAAIVDAAPAVLSGRE